MRVWLSPENCLETQRPHRAHGCDNRPDLHGYDLGSIASALLFLVPDFHLSTFMTSVVTSAMVLGQLFGAFAAGRISNTIGRNSTLVLVALGYAAFAGLQGLAPNEWFLTVVRFLLGLAIGISIVVAPAYIVGSAPVSVRGSMLVTFQIATTSGIAVAYFVGAALAGTGSWRLILSLSAIPAVIACSSSSPARHGPLAPDERTA
ncbi:MAG TPA: MFS transporter [Rubrobacter sp.]